MEDPEKKEKKETSESPSKEEVISLWKRMEEKLDKLLTQKPPEGDQKPAQVPVPPPPPPKEKEEKEEKPRTGFLDWLW